MAVFTGAAVYKNASITVNATEYANQLTTARLVPEANTQAQRTLVPDGTVVDVDSAIWTFELSGLQSIAVTGTSGLTDLLNAAEPGEQLDVVLQPKVGTGLRTATFTILALPVAFGGEQGAWLTFEGVFPVVGQPVFGTDS